MMQLHLYFFILIAAAAKAVQASGSGLSGALSDQSLFREDQALPLSDFTESTADQPSLAIDDSIWSLFSDTSISSSTENIALSPNDFSIASDPFAFADCSTSDNSIFPNAGESRQRRQARCDVLGKNVSSPMRSVPTIDHFDENLRETILREYPALYETLRLSQDNEEDNSACILITSGILPVGVCSSVTINDWTFRASRTFPWNWMYEVTLWELSYATPGMVDFDRSNLS